MTLIYQNHSLHLSASEQKVIMTHLSQNYLSALGRLRRCQDQFCGYDEKSRQSDRAYVDRIHKALSLCTSENRELIRREYFDPSPGTWMYLYFRYSRLERMKKKAFAEFLKNLDL
jgi:hypothetical protein